MSKKDVTIFWFRRDLRLTDNHGLYQALMSSSPVLPVFIFDTDILEGLKSREDKRVIFIHQAIHQIQGQLEDIGSSVYVIHDTPHNAFGKLLKEFSIQAVFTNHDYEPYAIDRDIRIAQLLDQHDIPFHTFKDQVNFERSEVVKSDGSPYTVFTPYSKVWKDLYLQSSKPRYPSENHTAHFLKGISYPIPTITDLGFQDVSVEFPSPLPDPEIIRHYEATRNLPAIDGTSRLSVHLRFGTVSVRELAAKASKWNGQWLNELIWREFFMVILYHFPRIVTESFKPKYDAIQWRNNEDEFEHWCKGETGYPMVDAGMRELNQTGFMHNRVRMVVASFLTKHLLIDWRWGEAYFAEKLLDYDLSANNGNWQWAAGSGCDSAPYFRIFNPSEQQRKFDPEYKYVRRWIPEYEPGYLTPIVEHDFARKRALEVYKAAVSQGQ